MGAARDRVPRLRALHDDAAPRRRARARGGRRDGVDPLLGLPRDGRGALPHRRGAASRRADRADAEPVVRAPTAVRHAGRGADERRTRGRLRCRQDARLVVPARPAARLGHHRRHHARRIHARRPRRRGRRRRLRVRPQRLPAGRRPRARRPLRRPLRARHRPLDGQPRVRVAALLQYGTSRREPGRRDMGVPERPARARRLRGAARALRGREPARDRRRRPRRVGSDQPRPLRLVQRRLPRGRRGLDRGAGHPAPRPEKDRRVSHAVVPVVSRLQPVPDRADGHGPAHDRHVRRLRRRGQRLHRARRLGPARGHDPARRRPRARLPDRRRRGNVGRRPPRGQRRRDRLPRRDWRQPPAARPRPRLVRHDARAEPDRDAALHAR